MEEYSKGWKARNVRLHYGGKWEEVAPVNTVQVFNWNGGMHVDIDAVVFRNYTMQSIIDLVTSDTEVQFLWNNIPASLDDYTYIYCESTLESNVIGTQASTIITTDSPAKNTISKTKISSVLLNESQTSTLVNLSTPKKTTINATLDDSPANNTRSAVKRLFLSSPCNENVRVANPKALSKKRKFFQPPSIPYFP